jgi:nicotinamide riboside transporter PnuC
MEKPQMNADERRWVEAVGWSAMVLSVVGVVLNNYRLWPCFVFWIVSNGVSAYIHHTVGPRSLMVRDLIFLALACVGLWQWTR